MMMVYWYGVLLYFIGIGAMMVRLMKEDRGADDKYESPEPTAKNIIIVTCQIILPALIPIINWIYGISLIAVTLNDEMWESIMDSLRGR